ncbi:aldolase/citrate lyase family protein [Actinocorallia lasiicapitis]
MLEPEIYAELDALLKPEDELLAARYPGDRPGRQPLHTVYVPADRAADAIVAQWGAQELAALERHGPPYPEELHGRVAAKLRSEPIEDLRLDFEDGYGHRDDAVEDAEARRAAAILLGRPAPFFGIRMKCLEAPTRRRAIRTLDLLLDGMGGVPDGFVVTLPKVTSVGQVEAMVRLCRALDPALRFEIQIETTQSVLGADGTALVARMVHAAEGLATGLHYGTYDYSAACGISAHHQAMDHPVADHAKAVMQVAAAGTGVRLSDGSTNILPVGETAQVRAAWELHLRLVRRSLERGFYQGWDLHAHQLPTRFAAAYAFYLRGAPQAAERLTAWLDRADSGFLDEPATARALAGFLRRGLECGALDEALYRPLVERV